MLFSSRCGKRRRCSLEEDLFLACSRIKLFYMATPGNSHSVPAAVGLSRADGPPRRQSGHSDDASCGCQAAMVCGCRYRSPLRAIIGEEPQRLLMAAFIRLPRGIRAEGCSASAFCDRSRVLFLSKKADRALEEGAGGLFEIER